MVLYLSKFKNWLVKKAVELLPFVPVIVMICALRLLTWKLYIKIEKIALVSKTSKIGELFILINSLRNFDSSSSLSLFSTITRQAPFLNASSIKVLPSVLEPFIAIKILPFVTS